METCYICGGDAPRVVGSRTFAFGKRSVEVEVEFHHCTTCDETFYVGDQAEAALRSAADQARREEGLLTGEEIRRIREHYRLSQRQLEVIIGAGPKTVVRWERGGVFQNATADTLLRVLREYPAVLFELARRKGIQVSRLPSVAIVDGIRSELVTGRVLTVAVAQRHRLASENTLAGVINDLVHDARSESAPALQASTSWIQEDSTLRRVA